MKFLFGAPFLFMNLIALAMHDQQKPIGVFRVPQVAKKKVKNDTAVQIRPKSTSPRRRSSSPAAVSIQPQVATLNLSPRSPEEVNPRNQSEMPELRRKGSPRNKHVEDTDERDLDILQRRNPLAILLKKYLDNTKPGSREAMRITQARTLALDLITIGEEEDALNEQICSLIEEKCRLSQQKIIKNAALMRLIDPQLPSRPSGTRNPFDQESDWQGTASSDDEGAPKRDSQSPFNVHAP